METIETFEELREFNKEFPQDKSLNAFDNKNILRAERILNKNTKQIAFAFVEPKNWSKLKDWEKENIFRQIDNLPLLAEPKESKAPRIRVKSKRSSNYI